MPRSENLSRYLRRIFITRNNGKPRKSIRPVASLLIASLAISAAVVFSVSVGARNLGWLWKAQPSTTANTSDAAKSAPSSVSVARHAALANAWALPPVAPTVTATKVDSLFTDVDNDGKADPGDTLKYTVTISASGADATGVTFTDTVDPNTTFVAGTLMTTPLARNDSYTATGNVRIQVPAGSGVLANDSDPDGVGPAITATAGSFSSAQGGDVVLAADGSFTYNPPAGFEGSDSFTYTLNDNDTPNNTDTGTVNITVSGMIWFINNNAGVSGDGRLTNPFKTLADFQAVNNGTGNHPAANDNIFVYESATDYVGPVTLLNGQKFIGQDATASIVSITGITLAPNSDALPATNSGNGTIVNITSAGAGINVGQNNTLRGFTGGNAATDINGSTIGTLNVSDVTLNGTGQALNLSSGTLNGTFGSISSTNSATTGITLSSIAGSLSTGSTTITNATGIGINAGSSSATLSFANTSVTGSGGTGVSLTSNTGAITFGSLDISPDAGQRGLLATDNTNTITATSGTITTGTGTAVEITRGSGTTNLAISLTAVNSSGANNGIKLVNTSGSFTVTGNGSTANSGGIITESTASASTADPNGKAIFLSGASNVTLRFMKVSVTVGGASGIQATNISGTNSLEKSLVDFNNSTPGGAGVVYGLRVENTNTNATVNVDATTFQNKLDGVTAVSYSINGNSQVTVNVTDNNTGDSFLSKYTGLFPSGIVMGCGDDAGSTAKCFFNVSNTSFVNAPSNGINDLEMTVQQSATLVPNISNNTFDKVGLPLATVGVININTTGSGRLGDNSNNALFSGNTITNIQSGPGPTFAYTAGGTNGYLGMRFGIDGNSGVNDKIKILNNDIRILARQGLLISSRGARNDVNVVVQGNTIGTAAQPVATSNRRGVEVETQNSASLKIQVLNNTSIAGAGTSNSNSSLHFRAGTDNTLGAANGTIFATVTGNTISNSNAANTTGRFRAETVDLGSGISAGNICLDLTNNTLDSAAKEFNLVHNSTGTFQFDNGGGNTGTVTTSGTITNVTTGCTGPTVLAPVVAEPTLAASSLNTTSGKSAGSQQSTDNDVLQALGGERPEQANTPRLSQAELNGIVLAAIERWREAGVSNGELNRMQKLAFEIADLPDDQLATFDSKVVRIDDTAAGYGWFADATPLEDSEFGVLVPDKERQATELSSAFGRVDLLTVVMRELRVASHAKFNAEGQQGWLLQGTLGTSTRRAPEFKLSDVAKLSAPNTKQAGAVAQASAKQEQNYQQVASTNAPRNSRVLRNHAMRPALSVADVLLNIGILPAGKSITITFNAQVKDPFPGPGAEVCNQGSVSGSNFTTVLTDDPSVGGAADPTCTPIDLQADLAVTKSDSPDPVIAGNNLTYTLNFVNNGPNAAGATVTDATPAGTTFVSASVTTGTGWGITSPAVGGTGNVVFSKALVASGETAVFQIVVKVNSSVANGSTINNSATAATTGATDPVPGNNTGTASTSVIAQADLSITKTDGVTEKVPGTGVTYTITVNNSGPSDANGVSVADTFPSDLTGVTFTSVAAGGATGNTAAGSGNISDTLNMPTGSSVTYTVNATVKSSATGTLSNTATVTAPAGVTDPNTANNSATDSDTLTPQADLSITKTDGVTSKVPGTSVTYTIVVSNSGPSDAPGTTVADTFPSDLTGVTFTSVAAGGATGNTAAGSGNISDTLSLPSGGSVTYTVNATVKASATGSLSNTATVTAGAGVTDPTPGNNSATDTDTLTPQADLSITKTDGATSAVPGTPVTYTITVTNNGPSDAPGTAVADTFPGTLSGVTFTSVAAGGATGNTASGSGSINDTVNMPSGSSVTYTVHANIAASATGSLSNTATVTAGAGVTDPTPGNNSATDTDTLTPSADVSVTKTDSPDPVVVNNNITYTITVTNNGPSDAASLSLSDAVPANTTLVSVTTPAGWSRTDAVPVGGTGTLTFTSASLASGGSSVFTVVVKVNNGTANGTTITNTANVSSATADPTPGNNSATATTLVQSNADLAISKLRSPSGTIDAGNNVTYTVQFINNGPAPASNVTVSDTLPAGVTVVSQTNPAGWTCNTLPAGGTGTITCTKGSMTNGETGTLTIVVAVSCSVANGASISNTATIASGAGSPPDNNSSNNSSTATFSVNNPAVTVTASVAMSQLPQNTHELINVGLAALASGGTTNCPPGPLTVQVFGDEDDQTPTANNEVFSPDAKDIAVGTLRLRAERVNSGDGRVYLIVVRSGSSFSTVTVVVPKSSSPANVSSVMAQAAAAKSFADSHNGAAPAGYFVIGDGPIIGNKQ
jgi:uncharacterized repeat protein (TIGR01451 family)